MTLLPIVLHDDIELWATGRLRELLAARVEAYTDNVYIDVKMPDSTVGKPRIVTIRRFGGGRLDAVREAPRLGVNVYALDEQEANDLARMVAALLGAAPDGDPVSRVDVTGGPYPVDEESAYLKRYITAEVISKGRNA